MEKLRLIFFAVMMIPVMLSAKEKECVGNGIIESWTFSPVQIGLFNVKGRFQIGLWNYNPNAYFKYCPLINFYTGV